ncbi:MAG: lysine--tRNA ligase [Deltaproteobacteria bacterium]|nr:lysine--tRNA ligase [Deltaproteobacteria bacterium]
MTEELSDLLAQRRQKLEALKQKDIPLYPNDFRVFHDIYSIRKSVEKAPPETITEQGPIFQTAGRIMAVNRFGKSAFIRVRDRTGQLQAYIRKDKVPAAAFDIFQKLEAGDFVGLTGPMFVTRTGEWTLLATDLKLICKALRPLPEKFHGLKDPEKRYRQRYLDLLVNPSVRELFIKRSRIIQCVREFLIAKDFLEVETPMMQPVPGGAEAAPFKTFHNALGMDLYLRIAPELYLKRLVVGGLERVFEINRNFRNEGVSTQHNPEFTMLEFYQAYATYEDLMTLTEEMFRYVAETVSGGLSLTYQGNTIDLGTAWKRMPLLEALEIYGGVSPEAISDRDRLLAVAEAKGIQITKKGSTGKMLTKLFDALVEPHLIQPTFITGYPVEVSPLSRRSETDPAFTERFELFIGGREVANGFSELNDPEDQKNRFLEQVRQRQAGDEEAHPMDEDYIEALEYGMPPTAGEGIGIDRMVMLFTDADSIREVIFFPHMKSRT